MPGTYQLQRALRFGAVDSAIVVALIGLPTAVTAVAGTFWAAHRGASGNLDSATISSNAIIQAALQTADTANETTRRTLEADRERRLWERRADLYVEVLAFIAHRQIKRQDAIKEYMWSPPDIQALIDERISSYAPPYGFQMEARIRAFASSAIVEAYLAATKAHDSCWALHLNQRHNERHPSDLPHPDEAEIKRVFLDAIAQFGKQADEADNTLTDLVRAELNEPPRQDP